LLSYLDKILRNKKVVPYIFIAPFLLMFSILMLWPIIYSFFLSFHQWSGIGDITFIGLANYLRLIRDPRFLRSLYNTVYYVAVSVSLQISIGLVVALALNSKLLKLRELFRVLLFSPVVVSTVAITITFSLIYDADYGLLNWFLGWFGFEGVAWLGRPRWALPAIILLAVWRYTGLTVVYFLAGLQSISKELYESARVDGADIWQQFKYITIPGLRHTLAFVTIVSIINSFMVFVEPYILTGGGPAFSTNTISLYLYQMGFRYGEFGYASAIGYSLVLIVFVLSLMQLKFFRIYEED